MINKDGLDRVKPNLDSLLTSIQRDIVSAAHEGKSAVELGPFHHDVVGDILPALKAGDFQAMVHNYNSSTNHKTITVLW